MNGNRAFLTWATALAICSAGSQGWVPAQNRSGEVDHPDFVTVQSELDYLKAAKLELILELKQATPRQIFEAISRKAKFEVVFEGRPLPETKRDASWKDVTVKRALDELGEEIGVSYRVDGPAKLTVIVE